MKTLIKVGDLVALNEDGRIRYVNVLKIGSNGAVDILAGDTVMLSDLKPLTSEQIENARSQGSLPRLIHTA